MKKLLASLLVIVLILSMVTGAMASEDEPAYEPADDSLVYEEAGDNWQEEIQEDNWPEETSAEEIIEEITEEIAEEVTEEVTEKVTEEITEESTEATTVEEVIETTPETESEETETEEAGSEELASEEETEIESETESESETEEEAYRVFIEENPDGSITILNLEGTSLDGYEIKEAENVLLYVQPNENMVLSDVTILKKDIYKAEERYNYEKDEYSYKDEDILGYLAVSDSAKEADNVKEADNAEREAVVNRIVLQISEYEQGYLIDFDMPCEDIIIVAQFEAAPVSEAKKVEIVDVEGGSVIFDAYPDQTIIEVIPGETVDITITADPEKEFTRLLVIDKEAYEREITGAFEFSEDEVLEEFISERTPVKVDEADAFEADEAEAEDEEDAALLEIEEVIPVNYSFEMPDRDVVIYAEFDNPLLMAETKFKVVKGSGSFSGLGDLSGEVDIYAGTSKSSIYYIQRGSSSSSATGVSEDYYLIDYNINTGISTIVATVMNGYYDPLPAYYYLNDRLYIIGRNSRLNNEYICSIWCVNLLNGDIEELINVTLADDPTSLGVDSLGNYYISCNYRELFVYDKSGNLIASGSGDWIDNIIAIDSSNGNIYYQGEYDWGYWGYSHYMASLNVARRSGSSITFAPDDRCITILYQSGFYNHNRCVEFFGGRYIADLSTFNSDTLYLVDSQRVSPSNLTDSSTTIDIINGGVSVSGVNISDSKALIMAVRTRPSEYSGSSDIGSVGSRAAYSSADNSLYVATDVNTITKYSIAESKSYGTITTKNPIYKTMVVNGSLAVIEKSGGAYFVECFSTANPTKVEITGSTKLKVGETGKCEAKYDGPLTVNSIFKSSDNSIVSADENGNLSAWKAGKATITVESEDGKLKASYTVTVEANSGSESSAMYVDGELSDNNDDNTYQTYGKAIYSYLNELADGTLMRVEYFSDASILVEYMNKFGAVSSRKTITKELSDFCGFFAGKDNYFIVFGQNNENEDDNVEVLRVVKYDKSWKRLSQTSIKGINTYIPVDAGSLRMDEANGILYIHTCHEMYASDNGLHHQANMTFEINENNMTLKDSYTGIMNISEGYVSHSFNQFIKVVDGMVYRVDHGDYSPRGIAFTMYDAVNGSMDSPTVRGNIYPFSNTYYNYNYTGASIGGMEVSTSYVVVAFNEDMDNSQNRNIKIVTVNRETYAVESHEITSYTAASNIDCYTPQLVKLTDGHMLLMWMEKNTSNNTWQCAFAQLNGAGQMVSSIVKKNYKLSDCQPILLSNGNVAWYVTDGTYTYLFSINPFDLFNADDKNIKCAPVLTAVDAKAATCTEEGHIKYWYCSACKKYYSDNEAKQEITLASTVISPFGHEFEYSKITQSSGKLTGTCKRCGLKINANVPTELKMLWTPYGTMHCYSELPDNKLPVGECIELWYVSSNGDEGYSDLIIKCSDSTVLEIPNRIEPESIIGMKGIKKGVVTVTIYPEYNPSLVIEQTIIVGTTDTITPEIITPDTMALNKTSAELGINNTLKLQVSSVTPANASRDVVWTSSNEKIATVDANGTVTGKARGKVVITATSKYRNVTAKCDVTVTFNDISSLSSNFKKAINWLADNGVVKGYDDGRFGQADACTRKQFAIMIWRYAGKPAASGKVPFVDCPYTKNSDSYKAILWASSKGIVKGYDDGSFRPDNTVTRQQVMIMLYRYAGKPAASGKMKFTDVYAGKNSDTYKAILWGSTKGITGGTGDGRTFSPNDSCLRRQIAMFLYKYNNLK